MFGVVGVRLPLAYISEEIVEPLAVGQPLAVGSPEAPFPNQARAVACLLKIFRQGPDAVGKRVLAFEVRIVNRLCEIPDIAPFCPFMVSPYKRVSGVLAGQKYASRRGTHRRTAIMLREPHAIAGKHIKIRGFNQFLAVGSDLCVPQVIGQNIDDIGFVFRQSRYCGEAGGK